jgi:hypothetical protein
MEEKKTREIMTVLEGDIFNERRFLSSQKLMLSLIVSTLAKLKSLLHRGWN